ncbi:MAG: hypothetical protein MRY78_03420 [Saprospiraceae bacterium]|nr:hypothetical protein [Saprospiraceae bacterium]
MRITGYIEHPVYKITIFQMDNKFSVKFETGLFEQTYKFRTGEGIESEADIRKLIDEAFLEGVGLAFQQMNGNRNGALARVAQASMDDEFDTII